MTTHWTLIAFRHPDEEHSLVYKRKLSTASLVTAVADAIALGANLMSIRGFEERAVVGGEDA